MRILVVGAGIGGLTFAYSLQYFHRLFNNLNFSIEIAERSKDFEDGLAIILHPNGLNVLSAIGLSKKVHSLSCVIDAMKIINNSEDYKINMNDVWGKDNSICVIRRKDLHKLIAESISQYDNVPVNIQMGRVVRNILYKEHSVVACFENGNTETFDLIIGADGINSVIRNILFPITKLESTNLLYFRFIAKNIFDFGRNIWTIFERSEGAYGFIPLPNNYVHCYVELESDKVPYVQGNEELYFRQSVISWSPLLSKAFDIRCGSLHASMTYLIPPFNWNRHKCVLLGDAAHAVSPTLSAGGSLAMEDALVLSLALLSSTSMDEAIQLYTTVRRNRCMRAYRITLLQLNSLRKRRNNFSNSTVSPDDKMQTHMMEKIFKIFIEDWLPQEFKSILIRLSLNGKNY